MLNWWIWVDCTCDADIQDGSHTDYCLRLDLPPQNLHFTGRQQELKQLSDIVQGAGRNQRKIAVLHGLGGIGKTNIVLQYAWQEYATYSCIVWICAASTETLRLSFIQVVESLIEHLTAKFGYPHPDFTKIAAYLGIHGLIDFSGQLVYNVQSTDLDKIVAAVPKWLSQDGNDQWLLVFDNVDDLNVVNEGKHFPKGSSGTIIITSQRWETANSGTGSFEVCGMDPNDALDFLIKQSQLPRNQLSKAGKSFLLLY